MAPRPQLFMATFGDLLELLAVFVFIVVFFPRNSEGIPALIGFFLLKCDRGASHHLVINLPQQPEQLWGLCPNLPAAFSCEISWLIPVGIS
jgi:hypothetical protein